MTTTVEIYKSRRDQLKADITLEGFHIFRCNTAKFFDLELSEVYWKARDDWEKYAEKMLELADICKDCYGPLTAKQLFEFLSQPASSGQISYGFCKKICRMLNEYKGTVQVNNFLYTNYADGIKNDHVDGFVIAGIMKSCSEHKTSLKWQQIAE